MSDSTDQPTDTGRPAASVMMPRGAICRACGYDLSGQPLSGVCPECATPNRMSQGSAALVEANPVWVRRLRRGMTLLSVGLTVMLFFGLLLGSVIGFLISRFGMSMSLTYLLYGILLLAAVLVYVMGIWLVTTPEFMVGEEGPLRRIARFGVCADLLSTPLAGVVQAGVFGVSSVSGSMVSAYSVIIAIISLAGTVGWIAFGCYLPQIIRRNGQPRLARTLGASVVAYAIIALLIGVGGFGLVIFMPQALAGNPTPAFMAIGLSLCGLTGILLIVGAVVITCSFMFAHALRTTERTARARWDNLLGEDRFTMVPAEG
ncbi:MAG: hypothetical protein AAF432_04855 [Planctomycetota bacterium]